jgi:hypothetical protein
MRIYNGIDGDLLYSTCNTNGTLFEYPLVADVDNDGQADIIVVSNNYAFDCEGPGSGRTTGVRIFGDANNSWVRTRRVWNQHAYHVTNVSESGEIPSIEIANNTVPRLNNYRQNVQPTGEFSAPDLVADVRCGGSSSLVATVRNLGSAAVGKGIPVAFYLGDPANGGVELPGSPVLTKYALFSTEAEQVTLQIQTPLPPDQTVHVVVDPGANHAWQECRVGNNTATTSSNCQVD